MSGELLPAGQEEQWTNRDKGREEASTAWRTSSKHMGCLKIIHLDALSFSNVVWGLDLDVFVDIPVRTLKQIIFLEPTEVLMFYVEKIQTSRAYPKVE